MPQALPKCSIFLFILSKRYMTNSVNVLKPYIRRKQRRFPFFQKQKKKKNKKVVGFLVINLKMQRMQR